MTFPHAIVKSNLPWMQATFNRKGWEPMNKLQQQCWWWQRKGRGSLHSRVQQGWYCSLDDYLGGLAADSLMGKATRISWRAPRTQGTLWGAEQATQWQRSLCLPQLSKVPPDGHKKKKNGIMLCITAQSIFYTFLIHTEFLKNVTSMQTEGRIYFVWFNTVEAVQFQKSHC